jgi:8-oxo-dGTP pyrophosphatase MutT (NUDIX family)
VPDRKSTTRIQAAALGYVETAGRLRYVVVTSRRTRRWIFPKGAVDAGESPAAAAARELHEEAGALGTARGRPIGRYTALKLTPEGFVPLLVQLFPVSVRSLLDHWDEKSQRERRLMEAEEAAGMIATHEMAELIVAFERLHRRGAL